MTTPALAAIERCRATRRSLTAAQVDTSEAAWVRPAFVAALILAALASFVSVVPVLASPLRSLREMPGVNGEAQPTDGETMGVISVETTGETEGVAAGVAEREAAAEALPEAIVAGAAHKEAGLPWTGSPAVDRRLGRD